MPILPLSHSDCHEPQKKSFFAVRFDSNQPCSITRFEQRIHMMSVTPDTPTLFLVGTVIGIFMCIMNFFASFYLHTKALRLWSASNFLSVMACLFLFLCTLVDSVFFTIAAYVACLLTLAFVSAGVEVFDGKKFPQTEIIFVSILSIALLGLSMAYDNNIGRRIVILALGLFYFAVRASWTLLRSGAKYDVGRKACAIVLLLFTTLYLVRGWGVWAANMGVTEIKTGFNGGMIRVFALTMSIAWNFCLLFMALDRKACMDELTGLLNRRALFARGNKIIASMATSGKPVSVLMMDLDHFKSINDRFGHDVGDAVLQKFARIVEQAEHKGDISGRLGGEEFCLLLPNAAIDLARDTANALRAETEHRLDSVLGHPIKGTVSIGVVACDGPAAALSVLLRQADALLYEAKRQGRNCVAAGSQAMCCGEQGD